jgi:VWFA-related protein
MRRLGLAILPASLLGAALLTAQAPASTSQTATFRSGVEIVEMDVVVKDRTGRPVQDLKRTDFTVLENGVEQPIFVFKPVDLPDATAFEAPWMRDVAPDVVYNRVDAERVVLLVFDDFNTSSEPRDADTVRHIGRDIIEQLGPLDMAGVMYTVAQQSSQEFTTDRSRLLDAVNRFTSRGFTRGYDTLGMAAQDSTAGIPSGMCQAGDCVLAALEQAAKALNGWPGKRKTIAFISPQPGFNFNLNVEQNDTLGNINARGDQNSIARTFAALRDAHVNVYQFDPRGVTGAGIDPNFGIFSDATGGRSISFNNTPWTRVPQLFVENDSFYLIGYAPLNTDRDGKRRNISVRVNRPGVTVSARSGYMAPDAKKLEKEAKKQPPDALDRAMTSLLPDGELPMGLSVAPFAVPGQSNPAIVIVAGLDRPGSSPVKDTVDVAARAYDESRADRRSRGVATAKLALTHRAPSAGNVHYDVSTRLDVAPGRYEVRVAMTSPAMKETGSAFASVTVPDFAKEPLSLSGVIVSRLPYRPPTGRDTLAGLIPVTGTTSRQFSKAERIGAYVRVYQAMKNTVVPVSMSLRVVDAANKMVSGQTLTLPDLAFNPLTHAADYRMEVPLMRLAPGEHLLTIEAAAGGHTVQRHVRFTVRN